MRNILLIVRHYAIIAVAILAIMQSLLVSCTGGGSRIAADRGTPIEMRHAKFLSMTDHDGYTTAAIRNPWDTTRILQTYILVPDSADMPADMPDGVVLRVPLSRSIVYTGVHAQLIDRLGAADAIKGVCDAPYITTPSIVSALADGTVADCGSPMSPNIERIIMLRPDAILLSAYENSNDHNKVAAAGVPIIDCAEYMEVSPLARAEWMKFFGRLYGKGAEADSLFASTERQYLAVKNSIAGHTQRPLVLFDMIYNGAWSVPAARSSMGIMIDDAGGKNPFAEYEQTGSARLAPEEVLYRAGDTDIWLIRTFGKENVTRASLAADNPMYKRVGAYAKDNVYVCDTKATNYFGDAAFSPQLILAEMAALFAGDAADSLKYYKKLK